MVFACLIGLMLMWPLLRLTQGRPGALAAGSVLWDWFCLNLMFQAVVWPLQVSAEWSMVQALWLDLAVAGWSLMTGLILLVSSGWRSSLGRSGAMGLCLLLVLAEPALMAVVTLTSSDAVWVMWVSPIDTIAGLTTHPARIWPAHVMGVVVVAALGWLIVALSRGFAGGPRIAPMAKITGTDGPRSG